MYKATMSAISSLAIAGFLMLGSSSLAGAQSMSPSHMHSHMHMHMHKKTITGCLQKGDESGEYSMKTANGKMYGLTSKKVDLSEHVGHKVKLHGYITPESAEGAEANQQSAGTANGSMEKGGDIDMTVTSLKMVSKTCSMM